jgi:hypothetical protein
MPLYDCGRPDRLTCQTAFTRKPRYANVSCSQCGGDFGPGDHGFSHCEDHRQLAEWRRAMKGGVGEIITHLIEWHQKHAADYREQAHWDQPFTDTRWCKAKAEAHEDAAEYMLSQLKRG